MNQNFIIILIIVAIGGFIGGILTNFLINEKSNTPTELLIESNIENTLGTEYDAPSYYDPTSFKEIEYAGISPFFRTFSYEKDWVLLDGKLGPREFTFEIKPHLVDAFNELAVWDLQNPPVVILPIFTSSAYWKPGFYNYYREECDISCLTTNIEFEKPLGGAASAHAAKILNLLGYQMLTDIEVDKNPQILENYDKVIILHNEYVTKNEFEAITNHPNVIFLYPNSLYAEVEANYENNTITLIKGHFYPEKKIANGFDWEFDNSEEEKDLCLEFEWEFYEIENGKMLNCYPEKIIYLDLELLKAIKEL